MKKILLSFMLMAFCFFVLPEMTVSAAGSLWNRAMSGSVKYNDDSNDSTYGNSFDFIISSINIDTDDWGVFAYGTRSNDLNIVIISTHPFSVSYNFRCFGNKEFSSFSASSSAYNGLYRLSLAQGSNGYIHFMQSADIPVFNGDFDLLIEALINQDFSGFVSIPGPNVDAGTYDPEIGYLQDLEKNFKLLAIETKTDNYGSVINNRVFHFGWAPESSTGFNLLENDEVFVQVKFAPEGVLTNLSGGLISTFPVDTSSLVELHDLVPASLLQFEVPITDFVNDYFKSWFDLVNEEEGLFRSVKWKFRTYMRICVNGDNGYSFGGWSQIMLSDYVNSGLNTNSDFRISVSGGDFSGDSNDWIPSTDIVFADTTIGTGSSAEEAWYDSYYKDLYDTDVSLASDTFLNAVVSLSHDIGSLPEIMSSIMSFLPPYFITLLGVGLSVIVILRILGR